jgi:hypothetical protein
MTIPRSRSISECHLTPQDFELTGEATDLAIPFKREAYRENDDIVTLFTQRLGVISCHARGSRKPDSRISPYLQPLLLVRAELMASRIDRPLLKRVEIVGDYSVIAREPAVFCRVLESLGYMLRIFPRQEPEERLFNLTVRYLETAAAEMEHRPIGCTDDLTAHDLLSLAYLLKGAVLAGIAGDQITRSQGKAFISTPLGKVVPLFGRIGQNDLRKMERALMGALEKSISDSGLD